MPSNEYYDSSGVPATGSNIESAPLRAEFDAIEDGFKKLPGMTGRNSLPVFVNSGGSGLESLTAANARVALSAEDSTKKDSSDGYAGLTLLKINFKNTLNSFVSFLTNANTASRTYTFPDHDGTVVTFNGASNIDNTSDANKPISTAQASALNLKLDSANYTASDILAKIETVDGPGSGLDSDLLDGQHGAYYAPIANPVFTGAIRADYSTAASSMSITDANNLLKTGDFTACGTNCANLPDTSSWFHLMVSVHTGDPNYTIQYATRFDNALTYCRTRNGGSWGAWKFFHDMNTAPGTYGNPSYQRFPGRLILMCGGSSVATGTNISYPVTVTGTVSVALGFGVSCKGWTQDNGSGWTTGLKINHDYGSSTYIEWTVIGYI